MKKIIVVASILLSASPYLAYGWGTGKAAGSMPAPVAAATIPGSKMVLGEDRNHPQTERRGNVASRYSSETYPRIIPTEGR